MKALTLQEACIALAVEATTLYRWMERAGIEAETDSADKRRRTLTYAQVQQLARAHHRTLPKSIKGEGPDLDAMQQRIETLESRVEELARQVARLASPPTKTLRPKQTIYQAEAPVPGGNLPAGYVPIVDLIKQHNAPETTVMRYFRPYLQEGKYLHQGDWKTGDGRPVKYALDQEGQAEFMRRYVAQE